MKIDFKYYNENDFVGDCYVGEYLLDRIVYVE